MLRRDTRWVDAKGVRSGARHKNHPRKGQGHLFASESCCSRRVVKGVSIYAPACCLRFCWKGVPVTGSSTSGKLFSSCCGVSLQRRGWWCGASAPDAFPVLQPQPPKFFSLHFQLFFRGIFDDRPADGSGGPGPDGGRTVVPPKSRNSHSLATHLRLKIDSSNDFSLSKPTEEGGVQVSATLA